MLHLKCITIYSFNNTTYSIIALNLSNFVQTDKVNLNLEIHKMLDITDTVSRAEHNANLA